MDGDHGVSHRCRARKHPSADGDPRETVRSWCITASGLAVGAWALVALVFVAAASRVLPLLMGAHTATGVDEKALANVAEEIPVAAEKLSGSKVRWYVLEASAPNAFACGRSVQQGSIVVTRGLLSLLNRDELQAVVAHQLAHLKNGDAQFMLWLWPLFGWIRC